MPALPRLLALLFFFCVGHAALPVLAPSLLDRA
eukprot:COSAG01_NODE_47184_length_392_cov_47.672355_1_plen_32_part_01